MSAFNKCESDPEKFILIKIHTAKCSVCDKRNQDTLRRCPNCIYQICTPCFNEKNGAPLFHGTAVKTNSLPPPPPRRRGLDTAFQLGVKGQAPGEKRTGSPSLASQPSFKKVNTGAADVGGARYPAVNEPKPDLAHGGNLGQIRGKDVELQYSRLYEPGHEPTARVIPPYYQHQILIPDRIKRLTRPRASASAERIGQELRTDPDVQHALDLLTIREIVKHYAFKVSCNVELDEDQRTFILGQVLEASRKLMNRIDQDSSAAVRRVIKYNLDAKAEILSDVQKATLLGHVTDTVKQIVKRYEAEAKEAPQDRVTPTMGSAPNSSAPPVGLNAPSPPASVLPSVRSSAPGMEAETANVSGDVSLEGQLPSSHVPSSQFKAINCPTGAASSPYGQSPLSARDDNAPNRGPRLGAFTATPARRGTLAAELLASIPSDDEGSIPNKTSDPREIIAQTEIVTSSHVIRATSVETVTTESIENHDPVDN